ncbi:MAG: DUF1611 domain-containing protein [Armatimonadetes bacterium]|nr:DUF1611 domain-containing protein [Armatimonadota bacterium]
MLNPQDRIAIYMEGAVGDLAGKMGAGVLRYSPQQIVCVVDTHTAGNDARALLHIPGEPVPIVGRIEDALALGATVLLLGIAPLGGQIPESWLSDIDLAVESGLSIVNGLHTKLGPRYSQLKQGQRIWDIRIEPPGLKSGTGAASHLAAKRLLLVGTDMSVGKMTAGLEIYREMRDQGIRAEFVATGQIGMTIIGSGIPLDAIRVDFAAGSVEREIMRYPDADWIIIEGQGSLVHPSSTGPLPLIRGSCPTHIVFCARAGQTHLVRAPSVAIPDYNAFIELYLKTASACGTYAEPRCAAIALNTAHLDEKEAHDACEQISARTGFPTWDPVRHGAARFVEVLQRS